MARERYPGERRGLSLFLEDLRPAAARLCGTDSILVHAIRRALRSGDLGQLSAACVTHRQEPRPAAHELLERYSHRAPKPFVSFESAGQAAPERPALVSLTHELLPASAVRVMVSPGTLPRVAADDLRRIADQIEGDRRLLSERYWRRRGDRRPDEPAQAPSSSS
jgi:hypothetical protein